jgi:hypothetical protein
MPLLAFVQRKPLTTIFTRRIADPNEAGEP